MFIYGRDQQAFHLQRTEVEKWFSRLNIILLAVQVICFFASIIRFGIYSTHFMYNSVFTKSELRLIYDILDPTCVYPVKTSLGIFRNLEYNLSMKNVEYIVDRNMLDMRYIWAVTGLCLGFSIINFIWYEVNSHEVRYHFVVFHKDMIMTWEVVLLVLGMVLTFSVSQQNQLLNEYIMHCINPSPTSRVIYTPLATLFELHIFYVASLLAIGVNVVFAVANLLRKNPRKAFLSKAAAQVEMWRHLQAQGHPPEVPQALPRDSAAGPAPEGVREGLLYASTLRKTPVGEPGKASRPSRDIPRPSSRDPLNRPHPGREGEGPEKPNVPSVPCKVLGVHEDPMDPAPEAGRSPAKGSEKQATHPSPGLQGGPDRTTGEGGKPSEERTMSKGPH
ncbi:unnamed protein product [Phytomonas sp. Hart1]|nr:unnamed protein product [Phytomonas sp. Hart1]|eukprot:CCW70374.1 unnamed protein product [Phytomonas sp. isolate Hart1]